MSGEIDSPGECAGSDQDLDLLVAEKLLDQSALFFIEACVVQAYSKSQCKLQVLVDHLGGEDAHLRLCCYLNELNECTARDFVAIKAGW